MGGTGASTAVIGYTRSERSGAACTGNEGDLHIQAWPDLRRLGASEELILETIPPPLPLLEDGGGAPQVAASHGMDHLCDSSARMRKEWWKAADAGE